MRSASTIAVLVAIAGFSSSQTIDPSSVPKADRDQWCLSQKTQCPLICTQTSANSATTKSNTCDPKTLNYSCVCANGLSPNVTIYSQTIPYFECTEYNNQCVTHCGSDNQCASDCRTKNLCGAQNPTRVNTTMTTSSATAAATTSAANYNSFGSSGDSSNKSVAASLGASYGLVAVLGCLFAGVALVL